MSGEGAAPAWGEIDPWGAAPHVASNLPGLGGSEPSPEPRFAFGTAFLASGPGSLRMRMVFEKYHRSEEEFVLEISNRSDLPGSPPVRMRLQLMTLAAIADGEGCFELVIDVEPDTHYAVAGWIRPDHGLSITRLRIFVDRPVRPWPAQDWGSPPAAEPIGASSPTRGTARLTASETPSFTNPYSQPCTPSQLHEPAFGARCGELGSAVDARSWPEAFVLQALAKYGALAAGGFGIGFDCEAQLLPRALLARDVRVLVTRFDVPGGEANLGAELRALRSRTGDAQTFADAVRFTTLLPGNLPPGYFGAFDFSWWIAAGDVSPHAMALQVNAMACALRPGGLAVLVLPFSPGEVPASRPDGEPGRPITRRVIERFALEAIAQGHSVAQLRFGGPAGTADASHFGLIVARA